MSEVDCDCYNKTRITSVAVISLLRGTNQGLVDKESEVIIGGGLSKVLGMWLLPAMYFGSGVNYPRGAETDHT